MALLGDYVKACGGDAFAGMLLHRMAFLYPRASQTRDGVRWFITTQLELINATGLTRHRYLAAIDVLLGLGFIETKCMPAVTSRAMHATGFRVTEKAMAAIVEAAKIMSGDDVVEIGDRKRRYGRRQLGVEAVGHDPSQGPFCYRTAIQ